ncbi:hypothetical protein [Amycolatopsis sp. NPDC004378]
MRRRIHGAYQKTLAGQWGCTAVPADWLHLTVCSAAPGVVAAAERTYTAGQLAARLREGADDQVLQRRNGAGPGHRQR